MTTTTNTPADYAVQFQGAGLHREDLTVELLQEHYRCFGDTIEDADATRLVAQIREAMESRPITRETTCADIVSCLDDLDVEYTTTPDGLIRCELANEQQLNLYQHPASDGADIAGLWAWYLVGDCSGGLDSFEELAELVAE
jgi:hypothetical protein